MSKSIKKFSNKIKGKKRGDEKVEETNEDFWNAKSQRGKVNFDSEEETEEDFLVVENQKRMTNLSVSTTSDVRPEQNRNSPNMSVRPPAQSARATSARVQSARNRGSNQTSLPTPKLDVSPARASPVSRLPNEQRPQVTPDSKSQAAFLETENARLKQQLRQASANSSQKNNITQTLEAFMDRTQCPSLEHFTSRKEKFDLLDQAIARHDGNAITRIIIWLKDTLKRDPNLMKDLMAPDRAVGMNHYICYLKEMKEYDELSELLISLNRPEEAAYLEYQRKLELYKSAKARSNELDSTLRLHFDSQRELEFDAKLIREQKRLLDMQPKIIESDKKLKLESDHLKESDTVAQTLWYTCLNHYTNASREYSVDYIKRALDISQNEFEWIALTALAKQKNWELIEVMVKKGETGMFSKISGALTGPKFETSIQLSNLVHILGNNDMPVDKLRKFILAIDDIEERKEIAYRWKDHQSALECYQKTQDHQGLARHILEIPEDDVHRSIKIRYENALRDSKNW